MQRSDRSPFFSIIIPVYNSGERLRRTIESVIAQTYADWEMIIVDDGCKDKITIKILSEYEIKDARVRIIHQKNKGVSAARNTGMRSAHGFYLIFLDADDFLNLDLLEDNKRILDLYDCPVDILMREMRIIYEETGTTETTAYFKKSGCFKGKEKDGVIRELFEKGLYSGIGCCYTANLISDDRDLFREDWRMCEDVDWNLRQMLKAKVIAVSQESGYNYCLYKRDKGEPLYRYIDQVSVSRFWTTQKVSVSYPSEIEYAVRNRMARVFVHYSFKLDAFAPDIRNKVIDLCKENLDIAQKADHIQCWAFYYVAKVLSVRNAIKLWNFFYSRRKNK